ncbi:hypothetical protein Tcan_18888 [Toxocara canis]|uniref:Uncharacterized protein n=1 Tax=Toxocara canis TaxID=6265 RepID=A0A0B2V7G4_TOXCA|nr:hypothetical protein Tcan_18888 [Toxocara canis]
MQNHGYYLKGSLKVLVHPHLEIHREWLQRWLLFVVITLPSSNEISCHSNREDTAQEEDCGPDGYCFFKDLSDDDDVLYQRGCDHAFLCELIIQSNVSQPSWKFSMSTRAIKVEFEWCVDDVPFETSNGEQDTAVFCCCNTNFCNRDEPDERDQPYHKVEKLISGTRQDYEELEKLAKQLGIIKSDSTVINDNSTVIKNDSTVIKNDTTVTTNDSAVVGR